MDRTRIQVAALVFFACVSLVVADTITIDFESVADLTYVQGYRTKSGTITQSTDKPTSSTGTYSANFTWYTDGTYANQYAYMVKTYEDDMDFSAATISFWHKRTNRSNVVGVALYDNGNLVAEWDWTAATAWTLHSAEIGVYAPTTTGTGSITSVDEIRFMNGWTTGGTSGSSCIILYDDFVATGVVVPEPATMCLLISGAGCLLIRRKK